MTGMAAMAMGTNGRAAAPRRRTDQAGTTTRRRPTGSAGQKLDQNTIDRFPTNVVKKGAPEENCCICMDEIRAGSVCRRLPCFHTFHQECIDGWLRRNASCPICKRDPTT